MKKKIKNKIKKMFMTPELASIQKIDKERDVEGLLELIYPKDEFDHHCFSFSNKILKKKRKKMERNSIQRHCAKWKVNNQKFECILF